MRVVCMKTLDDVCFEDGLDLQVESREVFILALERGQQRLEDSMTPLANMLGDARTRSLWCEQWWSVPPLSGSC